MAALGPDIGLEGYADQEDRELGIDPDWGPDRSVFPWTIGKAAMEA